MSLVHTHERLAVPAWIGCWLMVRVASLQTASPEHVDLPQRGVDVSACRDTAQASRMNPEVLGRLDMCARAVRAGELALRE